MKIKNIVLNILTECPQARGDDNILFAEVLRRLEPQNAPDYREELISAFANWRGVSFETVRRTRQRIQQLQPDLRPSQRIQRRRQENTERILNDLYGA